ncbi:MAG: binary toxin-like calcium binding domain-containing protein [Planctomycetota bacterium]
MSAPILFLFGVGLCLGLGSCGSDFKPAPEPLTITTTVGEVYQLLLDSPGQDTDGDAIPDDVELDPLVDTDPDKADSDGDGVVDTFELFGRSFLFVVTDGKAGELHEEDILFDANLNLIQAAIDAAETCEQYMVDSDGDGVYNCLEYYGYTYDWEFGRFVLWTAADRQAHPEVPWFRTDPLQPSTDQDAYSDGMEVSQLLMDVAVEDPGRHPLVPALPNVVVRLEGYQVTLNDDITYEEGGSIAKGYSWSRETESSNSLSQNVGVEVGFETGYDDGVVAKGHVDVNWGIQWGNTTSSSQAVGGTVNEEINWNRARSHNPTQAAQLKLLLKVENHGTAPASNVVPTIHLSIGGAAVETFRPANLQINMLMPGAVYPEGDSTCWVVDSTENGPLMLTDWELRALESGAPVQIFIPQIDADVMLLNEEGTWESAGNVNEYMARCEAVGATLFADLGDGEFMHYRVYAGEGPTAPAVTLRDALRWAMGGTQENGDTYIEHEKADGTTEKVKLTSDQGEGWSIHMDRQSYESLGVDDHALDLRLTPTSHIELISPRDAVDVGPRIYSAYAVPLDGGYHVSACASDYDGIAMVEFVDRFSDRYAMAPDGRGPWFFSHNVPEGYEFAGNGAERVEVTSVNGSVSVAWLGVEVIHTVISKPPFIGRLLYDSQVPYTLRATIEPGTNLPQDAIKETDSWPRLYVPGSGYIHMKRTIFWFEEPNVYECELPGKLEDYPGMRVVAASVGGQYTAVDVKDVETLSPYGYGEIVFDSGVDWDLRVVYMMVPSANLDGSGHRQPKAIIQDYDGHSWPPWAHYVRHDGAWPGTELQPFSGNTTDEFYVRSAGDFFHASAFRVAFMNNCVGTMFTNNTGKSPDVYYQELSRNDVLAKAADFDSGKLHALQAGTVYGFRTTGGRYGKLLIKEVKTTISYTVFFPTYTVSHIDARYVIFRNP